jgi:hypothetical protein
LWHASKVPLFLTLFVGCFRFDLIHGTWLVMTLSLGAADARTTRRYWPILVGYTAIVLIVQSIWLVAAPLASSESGNLLEPARTSLPQDFGGDPTANEVGIFPSLIGLHAMPSNSAGILERAGAGWWRLGWAAILLPFHAAQVTGCHYHCHYRHLHSPRSLLLLPLQACVYASPQYVRLAAAYHWRLLRAQRAPQMSFFFGKTSNGVYRGWQVTRRHRHHHSCHATFISHIFHHPLCSCSGALGSPS